MYTLFFYCNVENPVEDVEQVSSFEKKTRIPSCLMYYVFVYYLTIKTWKFFLILFHLHLFPIDYEMYSMAILLYVLL